MKLSYFFNIRLYVTLIVGFISSINLYGQVYSVKEVIAHLRKGDYKPYEHFMKRMGYGKAYLQIDALKNNLEAQKELADSLEKMID